MILHLPSLSIALIHFSFSELLLFVEMAQTKEHAHGVDDYYNVFWDECRSIHSEHDSHGHLEPETKSKELDEGRLPYVATCGFLNKCRVTGWICISTLASRMVVLNALIPIK